MPSGNYSFVENGITSLLFRIAKHIGWGVKTVQHIDKGENEIVVLLYFTCEYKWGYLHARL